MQTNLLHTFLLVLQYGVTGATIMGKQLQPCSVLGSFGVVLLSCDANFHVVPISFAEFDASTLYIFPDQVFSRSYVLWYIPPLTVRRLADTFLESFFSVTSDFYFSACFSGGEKRRPETRLRSQATLQP